jgi:hypothetical protein
MAKKKIIIRKQVASIQGMAGIPFVDQDLANNGAVTAILNHGRWIVMCPDDPMGMHAMVVDPNKSILFVCASCYPDVRAKAFQKGEDELFRAVDDKPKQQAARDQAALEGRAYKIIFPDNVDEIIDAVRYRPTINMNWIPGETLEFLRAENIAHNVGPTLPQVSKVGGK